MLKRFNFLGGSNTSAIDIDDTTINTTEILPALASGDYFWVVIDYGRTLNDGPEIVKVVATSGSSMTVERGQLDTVARAHPIDILWCNGPLASDFDLPISSYTHVQTVPSTVWTINHPLNFYPNVRIEDSTGDEVFAAIAQSSGQIIITFSAAVAGTVYLS